MGNWVACASKRYGTSIRCADPAVLNILSALCFVYQQVLFSVGGDIDLLVCVGLPSTGCTCLIYLPAQKVAFSHMCESGAGVRLARSFPPGIRGSGCCGGVTNILAEHYQQQHKHGLAETQLLIGIFVCVCVYVCVPVTLWV